MSKFFKVLFAIVPTAVVFSAVVRRVAGIMAAGGPTTQKDIRLVQLIHINANSPYYLGK